MDRQKSAFSGAFPRAMIAKSDRSGRPIAMAVDATDLDFIFRSRLKTREPRLTEDVSGSFGGMINDELLWT